VSNYSPGFKLYLRFCASHRVFFPPSAEDLIAFATHLFSNQALPLATVRRYITALRSACVDFGACLTPFGDARLSRLLAGLARIRPPASSGARPTRLPVTPDLLSQLLGLLSAESHSGRALRAALALGFFGLMRAGEFTYKGPDSTLLLRRHVTWRPAHVEVFLPTSKTDRAGRGVVIRLFPSGNALCAVALLREAWSAAALRSPDAPLLQVDPQGSPLTYSALLDFIKKGTERLGLNPASFGAHSLRIGGATQLAASNFSDSQIQAAGRWTSDCFRRYVRFGDGFYQHVASSLARGPPTPAHHRRPDWSHSRAPSQGGTRTPFGPHSQLTFSSPPSFVRLALE
jgi:hypothetical protein